MIMSFTPAACGRTVGRKPARFVRACGAWAAGLALSGSLWAQASVQPPVCELRAPTQRPLVYESVEVLGDQRVTFRLCAPAAQAVRLISSDIDSVPGGFDGKPAGLPMVLDAQGYWRVTTPAPVAPGPYRYGFSVDAVEMPDPQARQHSLLLRGVRSVFEVPGDAAGLARDQAGLAQGVVSVFSYSSASLGVQRQAHVYTPPGYEAEGSRRYPVLYLLHGYGDSDDSWTSIGHAHRLLDKLIAAGKATPMIVVMPQAHTPDRPGLVGMNNEDFGADLHQDLIPQIDARYRTLAQPAQRAMVGLSMGGMHTLNFGLPRPDVFGAIGVFSMGAGLGSPTALDDFRQRHAPGLKQRAEQGGLVFYAYGKADFIYALAAPTRQVLDDFKIRHTWYETEGGHTWATWRQDLSVLAPQLFR